MQQAETQKKTLNKTRVCKGYNKSMGKFKTVDEYVTMLHVQLWTYRTHREHRHQSHRRRRHRRRIATTLFKIQRIWSISTE